MKTPLARTIITVDGLAASGKSSIARELARRLGFIHFSTGLLYRAVGSEALEQEVDLNDEEALGRFVESHFWELALDNDGAGRVLMDGVPVARDLSAPRSSEAASRVGASRRVRKALLKPQRGAFSPQPMVAEGRDLGTVIFPDAALKLFVEAPEEVRMARRMLQLQERGGAGSEANSSEGESGQADRAVLRAEIVERDRRDAERAVAPTVPAPDAIRVDNGSRALTEVVDSLYALALSRGLVAGS